MTDDGRRFESLVQSPLRAALLRFLHAHPHETFDVDTLMQAFGRLRLDVENCLREIESYGAATRGRDGRWRAAAPEPERARALVAAFAAARPAPSAEEQSESVRRFRELIGRDEKMLIVFEWIRTAAKADIAVLILGPTGSGKEVVARMIHELSPRGAHGLQAVNCAAVPAQLFEAELFGHERGAFTGAYERRRGKLELADKGTLFLDGISDLSLPLQGALLGALEHRRFERVGGSEPVSSDFRLISATSQPLEQLVRDGRFREDLFYRINAFSIRLPSLRERAADIPVLAERFLAQHAAAQGLEPGATRFTPDALRALSSHTWPGNVRELESVVVRALLQASSRAIGPDDLRIGGDMREGSGPSPSLMTLADAERRHIEAVLIATGWNKQRAAAALGVSRGTLYRKIREYALAPGTPAEL